jgi:hypothetical protein
MLKRLWRRLFRRHNTQIPATQPAIQIDASTEGITRGWRAYGLIAQDFVDNPAMCSDQDETRYYDTRVIDQGLTSVDWRVDQIRTVELEAIEKQPTRELWPLGR